MKPRLARSKTMRVATALTGMTACATAFGPAVTAQAATKSHHTAPPEFKIVDLGRAGKAGLRVRVPGHTPGAAIPDSPVPNLHYSLGMTIGPGVSKFHVCGYHLNGAWRCTNEITGLDKSSIYSAWNIGRNVESWQRGATDVYWNNGGAGNWDTCNTNGAYIGGTGFYLKTTGVWVSSPYYVWLSPVGPGHPEC
jgi:hypothetical protein